MTQMRYNVIVPCQRCGSNFPVDLGKHPETFEGKKKNCKCGNCGKVNKYVLTNIGKVPQ